MELIDNITNYNRIYIIKYDNITSLYYYKFLRNLISYQLKKNNIEYNDLSQIDWFDDHNKAIKKHIKKTNDIYLFPIYRIEHPQFHNTKRDTFMKVNKFILTTDTFSISTSFTNYDYKIVQQSDLVIHLHNDKVKILKDRYGPYDLEFSLEKEYKLVNRYKKIKRIYDRNKEIFG